MNDHSRNRREINLTAGTFANRGRCAVDALLPLLLVLFCSVPTFSQEVPNSRWWYPSATPEATRRNDVATESQQSGDLVVKWRTSALRGSRTLLVGALSTPSESRAQQIVGIRSGFDTLVILDDAGFVDTSYSVLSREGSDTRVTRLTGLYRLASTSVTPTGRPDAIGIAIERPVTSVSELVSRAYGMLLTPNGEVITRLGISRPEAEAVRANQREENRYVTINPVALFRPDGFAGTVAYALASQDRYFSDSSVGADDTWINGLRVYMIPDSTPTPVYALPAEPTFRIAPKTWWSQPAITYSANDRNHVFSLSTEAYAFADTVRSGAVGESSRTREAAAMHLQLPVAGSVVRGISEYLGNGTRASQSLFSRILVDTDTSDVPVSSYVRFAWDVREARSSPGPRLQLTNFRTNINDPFAQGLITADSQLYDGLDVIVADLDGTSPGNRARDSVRLINNPGPEIIVSQRQTGSDAVDVRIYRFNNRVPIRDLALGYFTQQKLRGRIVAAGDLVADPEERTELILLDRDSLRVLQFRSYVTDWEKIVPFNPDLAEPLETVAAFGLGDSILTAVIADVEGDGENDIVASTGSGTWLIGRLASPAFDWQKEQEPNRICPGDTIDLVWERRTVGGGAGIRVILKGPTSERRITNPGVLTGDRLTATPSQVSMSTPGEYRLIITDEALPHLSDTSAPFTFQVPELGMLSFDGGPGIKSAGTLLSDTIAARCVDDIKLQQSFDGRSWQEVDEGAGGVEQMPGSDSALVRATLPCPSAGDCRVAPEGEIYYRLISTNDTGAVVSIVVETEVIELNLVTSDTLPTRLREVTWDPEGMSCGTVIFFLRGESVVKWFDTLSADAGRFTFDVPREVTDSAVLCVTCFESDACAGGSVSFRVPAAGEGDYIAPNPFSPDIRRGSENQASIVYTLGEEAEVSIAIVDAGRSTVREVLRSAYRPAGRHREAWDGTDRDGNSVANGTYFCVISFSTGENIILPFIVIQ